MAFLSLARGELVYHASMPVLRASLSNQTCGLKLATTYSHTSYDYNGNIIEDAEGRSFTFNGDDKQTEVKDANNQTIGEYFYDGSGARVKKVVPNTGETTIFVYDAGGSLAAEYSTIQNPEPAVSYLTTDNLGSPRVITDQDGEVVARRDFMPFGEELGAGAGPRTTNLKYSYTGSDNIRKRFTGYEKDDETGLDFAEARMFQNRHGRFTAVDPLLASASAMNPQTFNRYTYTGNNPINYTDPSGLKWCKNPETGIVGWNSSDEPCPNKGEDVTGKTLTFTGEYDGVDSRGTHIFNGARVTFGDNETLYASYGSPSGSDDGAVVVEFQEELLSTSAGEISTNISPRSFDPFPGLGCVAGLPCSRETWSNPLAP